MLDAQWYEVMVNHNDNGGDVDDNGDDDDEEDKNICFSLGNIVSQSREN